MGTHLRICSSVCLVFIITIFTTIPISERPKPYTRLLVFWDVGQGDFATYIEKNNCWAFDVGGNKPIPSLAYKTLRKFCSNHEISVSLSHFDLDHIRNFKSLAHIMRIRQVIVSHKNPRSSYAHHLLNWIEKEQIPIHLYSEIHDMNIIWPKTIVPLPYKENDRSLVIQYANTLFTGDLSDKIEKQLTLPHVTNLKVGHHGSRTSTSQFLLNSTHPLQCIVSSGKNTYGHPNHETLRRISQSRCTILRTDKLGNIFIILD